MDDESLPARFLWLGHPIVNINDREVSLQTHKAVALLTYLTTTHRSFTRAHLSSLFWPDFDNRRSQANLRQSLLQIRQILGHNFLLTEHGTVAVNPIYSYFCDIDNLDYTLLIYESHNHSHHSTCNQCKNNMLSFIDNYRGPFLEGFYIPGCSEFEIWQEAQRQILENKVSLVFERLIYSLIISEQFQKATFYTRKWLTKDSCNENAHRLLMCLYYHLDEKYNAIKQYENCATTLKEELGVKPEPRTKKLLDSIIDDSLNLKSFLNLNVPMLSPSTDSIPYSSLKFSVPIPPTKLLIRKRLVKTLDASLSTPITIVSGAAGYGKTTLISSWVRNIADKHLRHIFWINIESSDNEISTFFSSLCKTLGIRDTFLPPFKDQSYTSSNERQDSLMIDAITNHLQAINGQVILIIDDFHLIKETSIYNMIENLIANMPFNTHLIFSTRSTHFFHLSRLRLHKQVIEINNEDLRLDNEEINSLFELFNIKLAKSDIELLQKKTEGWITGLQILINANDYDPQNKLMFQSFDWEHNQIMTYLFEEVFNLLDKDTQLFLVDCSIVKKMNASLGRAITNIDVCQEKLEMLADMNIFLSPVDDKRIWFSFHTLFRKMLKIRLAQNAKLNDIKILHMNAAKWYESNQLFDEAISHYLLAHDYKSVVRIVDITFINKLSHGEQGIILNWLQKIPLKRVHHSPILCISKSWALLFSGLIEQGVLYIKMAESNVSHITAGKKTQYTSYITAANAFIEESKGNDKQGIAHALKAIMLLPNDDYFFHGIMYFLLGRLYRKAGDLECSMEKFEKVEELGNLYENNMMKAIGVCDIATILQIQGKLGKAQETCRNLILQNSEKSFVRQTVMARIMFRFADILYEKNRITEAKKYISVGLRSMYCRQNPNDLVFGYIELARCYIAQNNFHNARHVVQKLEDIKCQFDLHQHLRSWIEIIKIRVMELENNTQKAVSIAKKMISENSDFSLVKEFELIEYYRIIIHTINIKTDKEKIINTLENINKAANKAKEKKRCYRYYQLLILQAIGYNLVGDLRQSTTLMKQIIAAFEPEGYIRTFIDEGPIMKDILQRCLTENDNMTYTDHNYIYALIESFPVNTD